MRYTVYIELDPTDLPDWSPEVGDQVLAFLQPEGDAADTTVGTAPSGRPFIETTLDAYSALTAAAATANGVTLAVGSVAGSVTIALLHVTTEEEANATAREAATMPQLFSVTEVATLVGVSRQAVLQRVDSGTLESVRIGRAIGIPRRAAVNWRTAREAVDAISGGL